MLELQLEIQLEGQINLEMEIQNTEIVVKEGFDHFDIDWINPTLSDGTLTADFAFSPSPQEDVNKIELWINGALSETRESNDESPFVVNGIVGAAEVLIKAYNNDLLMQESQHFQLPIPVAPDFTDFSFSSSKTIDVIAECSDPQNLPIAIKYLGIPTNGLVSLLDSDSILIQEIDRNNPTLIPYVIENSAGVTDSGEITFHWEEISIEIDTPAEDQEIPSNEDITVAFTATPEEQNYISAIALVIDGVEVEKRSPYSGDDFVIDAGTLTEAAHTLRIRAYDFDDVQVFETGVRSFEVISSFSFGNALQFDGQDDFCSANSGEFGNNLSSFTLSWWWKLPSENFMIGSIISATNTWFIYYASGFLRIGIRNGATGAAQYEIPLPTEWTHFFVIYDGSLSENLRVQLYVDGIHVPINSFTGSVASSLSATAGDNFVLNNLNNVIGAGVIDELIMKKSYTGTAQQAADIASGQDAAQIIPNPDRVYRFNESDPATVTVDEGSEGADLTLNNFTAPNFIPHT